MKKEWYSKDEVGVLLKRKDDEHKIELDMINRLRNVEKSQDYSIHQRQIDLKDKEIEELNIKYAVGLLLALVLIVVLTVTIFLIL